MVGLSCDGFVLGRVCLGWVCSWGGFVVRLVCRWAGFVVGLGLSCDGSVV